MDNSAAAVDELSVLAGIQEAEWRNVVEAEAFLTVAVSTSGETSR